jgi:hypothetical protein
MAWHPMSSDHLVLLTTDARLCLFNVAVDTAFPEQVRVRITPSLRLPSAPTARPSPCRGREFDTLF